MKYLLPFILAISISQTNLAQPIQLYLDPFAFGFTFPLDIKNCGDNRIFVVEQPGYIRIMDKLGNVNPTPFLDIHNEVNFNGERGLLTLAFSPHYKQDGYFYVNYVTDTGDGITRISRFHVSANDSNVADPTSEKVLFSLVQTYVNHKGATLMFGADGYLYDTQGDGGNTATGPSDPLHRAQDTTVYFGKILRLDVSNPDTTYTIPPSNPFYNHGVAKGEIWAYGVRNPWRCSFDRLTHDLWMADVGNNLYEEVDFQPAASTGGQNYGWSCYEGNFPYDTSGCAEGGFTWPIFTYGHSTVDGCAIMGGYVYRGSLFSRLWGLYLCTDLCSGRFWSIKQTSPGVFVNDTLQNFAINQYTSFGEDNNGELYICEIYSGNIYIITDTSNCLPVAFISQQDSSKSCNSVTLNAQFNDSLSYQWYSSAGEITGETTSQFTTEQAGWYKVMVSRHRAGCYAFSDSVYAAPYDTTVLVKTIPITDFCESEAPVSLDGYITPSGGTYTGRGVVANMFSPVSAGIGSDTIKYSYSDSTGCSSVEDFVLNVSVCTDIQTIEAFQQFTISPNPNYGSFKLQITGNRPGLLSIIISDVLGKIYTQREVHFNTASTTVPFELRNMAAGIYLLQVRSNQETSTKRFLVE